MVNYRWLRNPSHFKKGIDYILLVIGSKTSYLFLSSFGYSHLLDVVCPHSSGRGSGGGRFKKEKIYYSYDIPGIDRIRWIQE